MLKLQKIEKAIRIDAYSQKIKGSERKIAGRSPEAGRSKIPLWQEKWSHIPRLLIKK